MQSGLLYFNGTHFVHDKHILIAHGSGEITLNADNSADNRVKVKSTSSSVNSWVEVLNTSLGLGIQYGQTGMYCNHHSQWLLYKNSGDSYMRSESNFSLKSNEMWAGSFTVYSDRRTKEDITYRDDMSVKDVKVATFKIKTDSFKRTRVGVIAQDVQETIPEVVYEGDDKLLAVDYSALAVISINDIKKLYSKVEELEKRVAELEKGN
jgi:hypothetical protein